MDSVMIVACILWGIGLMLLGIYVYKSLTKGDRDY